MTNGTENSVVLLTSTEKSGQPWLLLLLHYHENTTLIWKTYFGTAPKLVNFTDSQEWYAFPDFRGRWKVCLLGADFPQKMETPDASLRIRRVVRFLLLGQVNDQRL